MRDYEPSDAARVRALIDGPIGVDHATGWQVGSAVPPTTPDPAAVRAARLEARLTVYAQYAVVVAEEAAAAVAGDDRRRSALRVARDAAAEHYAELRPGAAPDVAVPEAGPPFTFGDALTDALHELRHQEAVDAALARRLRSLHDTASARPPAPALPAGTSAPRLDVRF